MGYLVFLIIVIIIFAYSVKYGNPAAKYMPQSQSDSAAADTKALIAKIAATPEPSDAEVAAANTAASPNSNYTNDQTY